MQLQQCPQLFIYSQVKSNNSMRFLLIKYVITTLSNFLRTLQHAPRENQANSFEQLIDQIHSIEVIKLTSSVWCVIHSQFGKISRVKQIVQQVKSDLGIDYSYFKEPSQLLPRFLFVARQQRKKFCKRWCKQAGFRLGK